jgi:hypothetical protein
MPLPTRLPERPFIRRRYVVRDEPAPVARPTERGRRLALTLFVVGPAALVALLLATVCGGTILDCVPLWYDEVWYFNELSVFHTAGWDGGYTISHEWTAKLPAVHFGPHGPFFAAFYGTIARLTGLHLWTVPALNSAFVLLASMLWLACCRPTARQIWLAAAILTTFWPLVLYLPSSMQEGLHMAVAIGLAGLSTCLIRRPASRALLAAALVVVVAASQLRVTWAWVAVPLLWVALRPRTARQWTGLAVVAALIVLPLYVEAMLVNAPFNNFVHKVALRAETSKLAAVGMLFGHGFKSLLLYVAPTRDTWLQVGLRYQVLLVAAAAALHLNRARRESFDDDESPRQAPTEMGFVLLNLLCVVGFVIALYDVSDWRDYRVVAPHLLLSLMVLVASGARQWMTGYAVLAAMMGVLVVPQFAAFHQARCAVDPAEIAAFGEEGGDALEFRRGTSAWDNTLLIDVEHIESPLLAGLPGGIGVSVVSNWERQTWPPQAKYLLLKDTLAARLGAAQSMRKVAHTRLGGVYVQTR